MAFFLISKGCRKGGRGGSLKDFAVNVYYNLLFSLCCVMHSSNVPWEQNPFKRSSANLLRISGATISMAFSADGI